ncbi:hypothetical protein M9H77_14273 [Catharanthus roseus]|uniref:Uncharacterized protein n=1 Tax=Catharanthus roseus TaxID=4058 RepID=A0ACC0BMJ6_CATRO|nr:hypothetical protein M9H77_14273 [Catharanthus roseus]
MTMTDAIVDDPQALVASPLFSTRTSEKSSLFRIVCTKSGHIVANCYQVIDLPETWGKFTETGAGGRGRNDGQNGKGHGGRGSRQGTSAIAHVATSAPPPLAVSFGQSLRMYPPSFLAATSFNTPWMPIDTTRNIFNNNLWKLV